MSHSDVFVIGAGPAGLTAAYLLTKQGIATTVIEADPHYVGGISRTASYKDFLFDIGGHRFFSKSKEVVDLWNEILPDDFISRPRMSRIYYDGKYFSYPLKAFEALSNLGLVESAMCVLSFMYKQAFPNEKPVDLPRLGRQPVRRAAVLDLLQDLHREGVGHELRRDLGRLGRAAHQGPRPVDGDVARAAQLAAAGQEGPGHQGQRRGHQDADRYLPVSAQGSRHDVGRRRRARCASAAAKSTWARVSTACAGTRTRRCGPSRPRPRKARARPSPPRHVISSAPIRELLSGMSPRAGVQDGGRQAALPRLHHRRPDRREAGPVPRQLDLHPRAGRQGRPHPELPLLVARDGAGSEPVLPRPRVFLLRGRRAVERHGRRADRPGEEGAGADRPGRLERHQGRLRGAPEEGLSGLRRRLQGQRRDDPQPSWRRSFRRCTWSAATACTSTTTRTTP